MFYDETQAINKCEEEPSLIFSLIDEEHKELVDKLLTEKTVDINTKNIEEYQYYRLNVLSRTETYGNRTDVLKFQVYGY